MRLTEAALNRAHNTVFSLAQEARDLATAAEEAWADGSPATPELLVKLASLDRLRTRAADTAAILALARDRLPADRWIEAGGFTYLLEYRAVNHTAWIADGFGSRLEIFHAHRDQEWLFVAAIATARYDRHTHALTWRHASGAGKGIPWRENGIHPPFSLTALADLEATDPLAALLIRMHPAKARAEEWSLP